MFKKTIKFLGLRLSIIIFVIILLVLAIVLGLMVGYGFLGGGCLLYTSDAADEL